MQSPELLMMILGETCSPLPGTHWSSGATTNSAFLVGDDTVSNAIFAIAWVMDGYVCMKYSISHPRWNKTVNFRSPLSDSRVLDFLSDYFAALIKGI